MAIEINLLGCTIGYFLGVLVDDLMVARVLANFF